MKNHLVLLLLCQMLFAGLSRSLPNPQAPSSASIPGVDLSDLLKPAKNATMPDDDPFYTPPAGFEQQPLGAILASRPVPNALTLTNVSPIKVQNAWQLLYRTQNSVGVPVATVVTVIQPFNADPNHLFSYSYFSDSTFNGCSPSIALQEGTRDDDTFVQRQTAQVVVALSKGYYVSIADDEGPVAAFAAGLQQAYATLDSIRAALNSTSVTGIDANAITTMTGYSGGSIPTEFAAEILPDYAPELNIAGAAIGGLFPNITQYAIYTINGPNSDLVPPGLVGISKDYKNMSDWINTNLKPETRDKFMSVNNQCISTNTPLFTYENIGDFFVNGLDSLLYDPVPNSVLMWAGVMGLRGTPKIPLYYYHSASDEVSQVNSTDALVQRQCGQGANIEYERNTAPGVTHGTESILRLPGAFQWLVDRHNGVAPQTGCSVSNVSQATLQANDMAVFGMGVFSLLEALLLEPIGPRASVLAARSTPQAGFLGKAARRTVDWIIGKNSAEFD